MTCAANPAEIAQHDDDRTEDFHRFAEALTVVIADGEQRLLVELRGEEQADENRAERGAERVLHHGTQITLHEFGADAQHRLAAEPGRERRGNDHDQRQMATGNGVVRRVFTRFAAHRPMPIVTSR